MKISAVIPVKHSSSRLPGKNFLPFGESETLLEHKIKELQKVEKIFEIIVTSDSDKAQDIAEDLGVRFHRRPKQFCDESLPISHFFRSLGDFVKGDTVLWACVTSPLINADDYNKAIETWNLQKVNFESLITVYRFQHYLLNSKGPMNFEIGDKHVNSQMLPELYLFTNGIIIRPLNDILKQGSNFGYKSFYYEVPYEKSIDIDTKWDYEIAKMIHEKN